MATRLRISAPRVDQFFERENPPPVRNALTLEVVLVAPHYQIRRAFDSLGEPDPASRLDWDRNADTLPGYDSGFYDADSVIGPLPGLIPGSKIDADRVNVFFTVGQGNGRNVYRLKNAEDELERLGVDSGAVLSANDAYSPGFRTLQVPAVNFNIIFGDVTFSGYPPNYLQHTILHGRINAYPDKPLLVTGIHPTDSSKLIVRNDLNIPALANTDVELILFPEQYTTFVDPVKATVPVSDFEPTEEVTTTARYSAGVEVADSQPLSNLDLINSVDVTFVNPSPLPSSPLTVTVDSSVVPPEVTVSLETDLAGTLAHSVSTGTLVTVTVPELEFDATLPTLPTPGSLALTVPDLCATGTLRVIPKADFAPGVDTDTFVLDDGVNPAVTFVYDDDASVVVTPTLRAILTAALTTAEEVRNATVAAINAAPTLDITAEPDPDDVTRVLLTNDLGGVVGNVAIIETVANANFLVTGMSGGVAAPTVGDDGLGALTGDATGTIDYETGAISFVFANPPDSGVISGTYRNQKNMVFQVQEAIVEAFKTVYATEHVPLRFLEDDGVQYFGAVAAELVFAGTDNALIAASSLSWNGVVEIRSAGDAGNDFTLTVTVSPSVSAPSKVQRIGNLLLVTLGTDGLGNFDPTKSLVTDLNTLFAAADNVARIVVNGTPTGTEYLTPYGMGVRKNHAGYRDILYGNTTSLAFTGGLDNGGVEVYGGLLPIYGDELVSAEVYVDYRALRLDTSPAASLSLTGNRPGLLEVRPNQVESKLGEISVDNPLAMLFHEYFKTSDDRRAFAVSMPAVSSEYPWGTQDGVNSVLNFMLRRDGYHIAIANDAFWMPQVVSSFAESLGGTEDVPLKKPLRFYISTKNFETEPDFPIAAGTGANRSNLDSSVMSASLDFVAAGVQAGDVIRFVGLEQEGTADVTLQDGTKGFEIAIVNKNGSPFTIETESPLPVSIVDRSFTVLRQGVSLFDDNQIYDSARAADVHYDWHQLSQNKHPRVNKHHCDSYESSVGGVFTELDGVFCLGKYMGIVARQTDYLPTSTLQYQDTRRVQGTSSTYAGDQLEQMAGAGLTMPFQSGTEDGPTTVFRDVSSETNSPVQRRIIQRRTSGVSEDRLAIRLERVIRPKLGPNLVNPQLLDYMSQEVSALEDQYRESEEFDYVRVVAIFPITDEIRQRYNFDDSGIVVQYEFKHHEEAARAIVRYKVVAPS